MAVITSCNTVSTQSRVEVRSWKGHAFKILSAIANATISTRPLDNGQEIEMAEYGPLTRVQRQYVLEQIPWVRYLERPTTCSARTAKGHMCTRKARWSYRYLPGQLTGIVSKRVCIHHLMYQGFGIDPSESARIEKWLVKHPEVLEAARKLKS